MVAQKIKGGPKGPFLNFFKNILKKVCRYGKYQLCLRCNGALDTENEKLTLF